MRLSMYILYIMYILCSWKYLKHIQSFFTSHKNVKYLLATQQTQNVQAMSVYRWSIVYDAGPTLNQHWLNVLRLLGIDSYCVLFAASL